MRRLAIIAAVVLSLAALPAAGQPAGEVSQGGADTSLAALLDRSNQQFFRGDYAAAAAGYQRLVELGAGDAAVLYNLGTAQARADQLGPAIHSLRRAAALAPGNTQVRQNLATTQALARARYTATDRVALKGADREGLVGRLLDHLASPGLAYGLLALEWLVVAAFLLRRRLVGDRMAPRLALNAVLGVVALVCALGLWGIGARAQETQARERAIVLADRAPAREGPSPTARAGFEVVAGLPVRLLSEEAGWVKLRLRNGLEGWVQVDAVGRL